jgi:signal transduction histidine kinase
MTPDCQRESGALAAFAPVLWEALVSERTGPRFAIELGERLGFPVDLWVAPGFAMGCVHEDDRPRIVAFWKTILGERYSEVKYRVSGADGSLVWLREAITITPERSGQRLRGVVTDISEEMNASLKLKRELALLGGALEATAEGLLVIDENRRIVASNQKLAQMWGIDPALLAPGPSDAALEYLLRVVANPIGFEKQIARPSTQKPHDGGDEIRLEDGRVFERYARPFMLDGRPVGIVVSCRDVTASRVAEAEKERLLVLETAAREAAEEASFRAQILAEDVRNSLEQLQQAQDEILRRERLSALGGIASAVAHEVRNALAASFNAVAALRRLVGTDGEIGVLLQIMEDEAKRLDRLVLDLLVFARPAHGTVTYQPANELVEDALFAALRAVESADEVTVTKNFADDLPPLYVDGGLVALALTNLLTNAIQAMPHGGTLTLSGALHVEGDKTFIELSIADTGPGIPEDVLPSVFEPFFTTKALGTGLGLSIAKRLIEEQRGRISLATEIGRGTTFTLLLPC